MSLHRLILVRTGAHEWTNEDRFAGWSDVDIAESGLESATRAAASLRAAGLDVDAAFTSVLKRDIKSAARVLEGLDRLWVPLHAHWRLNSRHAGALQGLHRAVARERYGEGVVEGWLTDPAAKPPALDPDHPRAALNSRRYIGIASFNRPRGESADDLARRLAPYWQAAVLPVFREGARVLIVAGRDVVHGLARHLDAMVETPLPTLADPQAETPLVYDLDTAFTPIRRYFMNREGRPVVPEERVEEV